MSLLQWNAPEAIYRFSADASPPSVLQERFALIPLVKKKVGETLQVSLAGDLWAGWLEALTELLASQPRGRMEVRVNLGTHWSLYVKSREGQSRLLLARPSLDRWVGTLSLEHSALRDWVEIMRAYSPGEGRWFGDLFALEAPTNLDCYIERAPL